VTEKTEKQQAEARKAAALRANLKRRKAAARKTTSEAPNKLPKDKQPL